VQRALYFQTKTSKFFNAAPVFNAEGSMIVVHGAGSVGCYLGGALAAAGVEVGLIGRPRIIAEIQQHALTISDLYGRRESVEPTRISLGEDARMLGQAKLILLCVKSRDTQNAAREIARYAAPQALVISFQNGVSNVQSLKDLCPEHNVLRGMVPFNIVHSGQGCWHQGTGGALMVEAHAALDPFLPLFTKAGLRIKTSADMHAIQWGKLLINLNNACNALSGVPLVEQLAQRDFRKIWAAALQEGMAVARAQGIEPAAVLKIPLPTFIRLLPLPNWLYALVMRRTTKLDPQARSSMWEDLEAGRPTEIDALQGEIIELGARFGIATPVNQALYSLIRAAEQGGNRHWKGRALRAALTL
jgi:2-dehydropantoate 2-reductase